MQLIILEEYGGRLYGVSLCMLHRRSRSYAVYTETNILVLGAMQLISSLCYDE